MPSSFELYCITDRTQIPTGSLDEFIERAIYAKVEWVQIREKDLGGRNLLAVTAAAVRQARGGRTRIVVNDRLDVALAAGAQGVHLGSRSIPADVVRKLVPREFVVGISCHSLLDALSAQKAGADYVLLGPIFSTPSKNQYGPPLGLRILREVTGQVSLPVFALGGITPARIADCRQNGAAGVAGIRIFQNGDSLPQLVRDMREHARV